MFTYLFGGALAGSTHPYLQFLLPGSLALAVLFLAAYGGVTLNRDLSTARSTGSARCRSGGQRQSPEEGCSAMPTATCSPRPWSSRRPGHGFPPRRRGGRGGGGLVVGCVRPVVGLDHARADPVHP